MLASFAKAALDRHHDATSRSYLAAALAMCGDRIAAQRYLPSEKGLTLNELAARQIAIDAMGTVPDLPEAEIQTLTSMIASKLLPARRSR
jgi:hypothetical protein